MFAFDWSAITEEIVHVGLVIGAIFQVICIGAAIFLPSKSDPLSEENGTGHKSGETANDTFLVESDESDNEASSGTNRRRRPENSTHQVHQRHTHQSHEETKGSHLNSGRAAKRNDKKKRRWLGGGGLHPFHGDLCYIGGALDSHQLENHPSDF